MHYHNHHHRHHHNHYYHLRIIKGFLRDKTKRKQNQINAEHPSQKQKKKKKKKENNNKQNKQKTKQTKQQKNKNKTHLHGRERQQHHEPEPHDEEHLLVNNVLREDAQVVQPFDRSRSSVLVERALGLAGEGLVQSVGPRNVVGKQELDHLERERKGKEKG